MSMAKVEGTMESFYTPRFEEVLLLRLPKHVAQDLYTLLIGADLQGGTAQNGTIQQSRNAILDILYNTLDEA
jgi:hypothetical protein